MNGRGGIVLGDLGHAKYIEIISSQENFNSRKSSKFFELDEYSAPEVIDKNSFSQMSDIWLVLVLHKKVCIFKKILNLNFKSKEFWLRSLRIK